MRNETCEICSHGARWSGDGDGDGFSFFAIPGIRPPLILSLLLSGKVNEIDTLQLHFRLYCD